MNGATPSKQINLGSRTGREPREASSARKRVVSASPSRTFKAGFNKDKKEMATEEYVDVIYKNKDPIAVSIKDRGNLTNTVPNPAAKAYFTFTFKKEGEEPEIVEEKGSKKKTIASGGTRKSTAALVKCPITKAVEDRKAAGSIISIANNSKKVEVEIHDFAIQSGPKPKIEAASTPSRKSTRV